MQCVNSNGNCVVRVVHGAKCDILPSKVHQTDTSKYTTHYAAGLWFPRQQRPLVLRSGSNSFANSGLALCVREQRFFGSRSRNLRWAAGLPRKIRNHRISGKRSHESVRGRADESEAASPPVYRVSEFFMDDAKLIAKSCRIYQL